MKMAIDPVVNPYPSRVLSSMSRTPDVSEQRNNLSAEASQDDTAVRSGDSTSATPNLEAGTDERSKVDELLKKMNIVMNAMDILARFSIHEATHQVMVKMVNVETGLVIREIPPLKVLDMVAKMQEMVGLLVDERA
jgi:flagellar protein FlaG